MAGEWRDSTLGNVTDFLSGGTPSKSRADYWNGSIPWVSAKDMKQFRLQDTEDHVTELGASNGTRLAPAGSVLLLVRGMTLLNDLPICVVTKPMTFNQDVKALRPNANVIDDFVPYLLLGNKDRLLSRVDLAGHGTGRLNSDELKALEIGLPPKAEQRAIAHILGTLDDKIELNRRRNQNLEAMARALFKDWFVDFGPVRAKMEGREPYLPADLWQIFPDRLDDEGKPEGWEIQPLDQIAALVTNSIAPGKTPEAVFEHYSIPAFDVGRMPAMEVGESIKSNKYIVDPDSVLVSKLNPQTPRIWLPAVVTDRAICSTEFMQFVPHNRETRSYLYCLMSSHAMQELVLQHVTGSTGSRQRAQPSQIAKVNILTPSPSVVMAFNRQADPILKSVGENQRESHALSQLRDTLLPKLISGELRIADAGKFLERVT